MASEIADNEPAMAFDGGMVGLKIIQRLIQESPKFLSENGWLIFEIGLGQGPFVIQLCEKSNNYNQIRSYTDNSENIRVIAVSQAKL
jgi:release factor glutamine methyltransferase